MKDNIVGPMTVFGYEIPANTVALTINWMTDGVWFDAAMLRKFLKESTVVGDCGDAIISCAADRMIDKARRAGLIKFDKSDRLWCRARK